MGAREATLGAEHPDTLNTKHNLALTMAQQGELQGAHELLEPVVSAREKQLGPEHAETLQSKEMLELIASMI